MRLLLVALLVAGCSSSSAPPKPSGRGRALYGSVCARCHGADGKGGAAQAAAVKPRDFTDATFQHARTDAQIRDAIVKGRAGGAMPPFGTTFTDEELDGLIQQVRSFGHPQGAP